MRRAAAVGLSVLAAACASAPAPPARVGPTVLLAAPLGAGKRFGGSASCRRCHGQAYERWLATGHAREYAGLPQAERGNPACLRCHVTGYGDPLGFGSAAVGADLAAVACEACHGPAADHAGSSHPDLVATATGGECPPCEVNRICRLCHTPEHSPGFELAAALARVSCGRGSTAPR